LNKRRADWKIRYAAGFQVPSAGGSAVNSKEQSPMTSEGLGTVVHA
jgi:hypothetical protein